MSFDDKNDSKQSILINNGGSLAIIGIEQIKNAYICDGSSVEELALKFHMPLESVQDIITKNELDKLRTAHIKHGLASLQNIQLVHAEKLMTIENQFKRMRILQLEKQLEDYLAYFSAHGHFYKVHPVTGEVLKDTNGIPMQIRIPNVAAEIKDLKESYTLSAGLKQALDQIDDIINKPKDVGVKVGETIDVGFDNLFSQKKTSGDDE